MDHESLAHFDPVETATAATITDDYVTTAMKPWATNFPKDDHSPQINRERGRIWGVALVNEKQLRHFGRPDLADQSLAEAERIAGPFAPLTTGPAAHDFLNGMNEALGLAHSHFAAQRN